MIDKPARGSEKQRLMPRLGLRPFLAAAVIGLWAAPATATVSFSASTFTQQLGSGGSQVIHLADVTGDRLDDLLTVDRGSDRLTIYRNQGGSFAAGDELTTDSGPVAVATGDFDRDGQVDIITVNEVGGSVSVFLGDAGGNFTEARRDTAVAGDLRGVAVFDFNDDANDDAVVLSGSRIYSLRSNGDGNLTLLSADGVRTRSSNGSSFAIAAGEIDDNGSIDVVVTNRDDAQLAVFLSNEDGTFTFSPEGLLNVGAEVTGIVVGDADDDAVSDLIAVDPAAQIFDELRLFLGQDGDGVFDSPVSVTANEQPFAIAPLDVDNDGSLDLVVTTQTASAMTLLCQPSSICNLQFEGEPLEAGIWRQGRFEPELTFSGQGQVAVTTGRINADDLDDIVALADDRRTIGVFLNTSTAGNTPAPTTASGTATPTPTGPTATPTATSTPSPTRTPTAIPTIPLGRCDIRLTSSVPTSVDPVAIATSDFDLDGRRDLAVADRAGNRVIVYYGAAGSGNTTDSDSCPKLDLTRGPAVRNIAAPVDLVAADFDRDSRPDLAVIGSDGLTTLFGPGSRGTFVQSAPIAAGAQPNEIVTEDFNRDGVPDVAVADAGGTSVQFFLGVADREFPFDGENCPFEIRKRARGLLAADLNRDSRADFAIISDQTNDISVFLRDAADDVDCGGIGNAFNALAPLSLSGNPRGLVARVFDLADAVPDLVVGVASTTVAGQVRLYVGQASGSTGVRYSAGTALADGGDPLSGPLTLASGDINRDARRDLVVLDTDGGADIIVYLGLAEGGFGVPLIPSSSGAGDARTLEVVDFDGDGRDDILVANASGDLTFMLSSDPPATPTPAPTFSPTRVLTSTPTLSPAPTITETTTRTRRPTETPTPIPTSTKRGVITLSGGTCAIAPDAARDFRGGAWPLAALLGILVARRRSR